MKTLALSLALLAPLPGAATSPVDGGDDEKGQASILRTYDLSSLLLPFDTGEMRIAMFPSLRGENYGSHDVDRPEEPQLDVLVEMVYALLEDEFEYEGRMLQVDPRGRMIVLAPPAVQEEVAQVVGILEGTLAQSTELTLDVVELERGDRGKAPSGIVAEKDVDAWLATVDDDRRRTYRLQVNPGQTTSLDLSRTIHVISEYDVEVAQSSFIFDPIHEVLPVGTRLKLRAGPQRGGMILALILEDGELIGDVVDRELPMQGTVGTEASFSVIPGAKLFQTANVLERSFALNTYLPDGKAIALRSYLDVGRSSSDVVHVLRRTGGKLDSYGSRGIGSRGWRLKSVNLESFTSPVVDTVGYVLEAGPEYPSAIIGRRGFDDPLLSAEMIPGDFDLGLELLQDWEVQSFEFGPWSLALLDEDAMEDLEEVETRTSTMMEAFEPEAGTVQLDVALVAGGREGQEVATLSVPARLGEPCSAIVAVEGSAVVDYDVEIASFTSVPDPIGVHTFEGLMIWMKPSRTLGGDLVVDVRVRGHVVAGGERTVDMKSALYTKVDQTAFDRLYLNERITFGQGKQASRPVVLGDTSPSSSAGRPSLSLSISAR